MSGATTKIKIVVPLITLAVWQVLCSAGILPAAKIPSPAAIVLAGTELIAAGLPPGNTMLLHCAYSLLRVVSGFALAAAAGIPLGIAMGRYRMLRTAITPIVETIRPIPPLAWIPLAILWFGIGLSSATFIIFLGCLFPILLSTVSGVLSVEPVLVDAAKTLGARDRDIFLKVLLPGAFPSICTGLRIGLGIGWMTLVAAEFTGVKSGYGLGYMIMTARDIQRPDMVIAGMAAIGIVGLALDGCLRIAESRLLSWRSVA
ncbi:ABC transporter permease [Thermodesulfobacteriota bacterium]